MVGFADMFIPAVLASTIESDITRFVIAAMSVTQLIYMSEVGALLLGSKIPVKLWELFVIFLLRTWSPCRSSPAWRTCCSKGCLEMKNGQPGLTVFMGARE